MAETSPTPIPRTLIEVPTKQARSSLRLALHAVFGVLLGPVCWGLAALHRTPGLHLRWRASGFGLRALVSSRRLSLRAIFHLFFMPMESTRYFEFDFAWKVLAHRPIRRYLDVSSPRLLPIALIDQRADLAASLINPNASDLAETRRFVDLIDAADRCHLHGCLIGEDPFEPGTFDAISSISVLEHIPEDAQAVRRIWDLLKPGGVLLLTVPCMAKASEQYIDRDEFGVLEKDQRGHVFWQRFYDGPMLQQRIFTVTGRPRAMAVYGEKEAGALHRNSMRKRADAAYPYWREPLMMGTAFRYFDTLEQLPGEGVVGLLFEKPT